MLTFIIVQNPLNPSEKKTFTEGSSFSVRGWLSKQFPGFVEFENPTICYVNGKPLMRKHWDDLLPEGSSTAFVTLPGWTNPLTWYIIATIIGMVAGALLISKPNYEQAQSESVYSIRGQQNKVRLREPVEVPYGKCRLWPSYAAIPYNRYEGNNQFQFTLLCLGQGEYDVHGVQIEDTPIGDFSDVEYRIYGPGESVSLIDDNVVTSTEVSGIELLGTNEEGYGYAGPFTTNEAGTNANKLEFDFVLPGGLYATTSKGKVVDASISFIVEIRPVDASASPLGDWAPVLIKTITMRTGTPQRFTYDFSTAAGRWQIRAKRTNEKNLSVSGANVIHFAALRAYLPSTRNYGNKTMLAVKMRATNQLNDQSAYRINVWATRKLPTWTGTVWTEPVPTRSIVWALCDIMKASYGGQVTDMYLALSEFGPLATIWENEGRNFDYVFDTRMTVWEAAKVCCRIGRAVPMLELNKVRIVRDVKQEIPTALFNVANIVKNSFKRNFNLPKDSEYDSVKIEYTDPTDFLPRTIDCRVGDDLGENPEAISFLGCTSRDWAYREGLYMRAMKKYTRQSVSFSTSFDGMLPEYGGLVAISHDSPKWGLGGMVSHLSVDRKTVYLDEPVEFSGDTGFIVFRMDNADPSEIFECVPGPDNKSVTLPVEFPQALQDDRERPLYLFGKTADTFGANCIISSIAPSEDGVSVEAYVMDPRVYQNDNAIAPPIEFENKPVIPDIPEMDCDSLRVFWYTKTKLVATWAAVYGAKSYEVETSFDNASWTPRGVVYTPSITIFDFSDSAGQGTVYVRARALNVGAGGWCVGSATITAENEKEPWEDDLLTPIGGVFCDLIDHDETLSGGLLFASKGGLITMTGYRELLPASGGARSVPPKRFRTMLGSAQSTVTLGWNLSCWYGGCETGWCGEGFGQDEAHTGIGHASFAANGHYSLATGVYSGTTSFAWESTGTAYCDAHSVAGLGADGYPNNKLIDPGAIPNFVTLAFAQDGYGLKAVKGVSCLHCGGSFAGSTVNATGGIRLYDEITEGEFFDDFVEKNGGFSNPSATPAESILEMRGVEDYTFVATQVIISGSWSGAIPGWPAYTIEVELEESPFDGANPGLRTWTDRPPLVLELDADFINPVVTLKETLLPWERGKAIRVKAYTILTGC